MLTKLAYSSAQIISFTKSVHTLGHSGKLVLVSKLGRRITLLHCLQWIMGMGGCYTDRNGSLLYFWNPAVELYGTGSENSCFLWDTNLY